MAQQPKTVTKAQIGRLGSAVKDAAIRRWLRDNQLVPRDGDLKAVPRQVDTGESSDVSPPTTLVEWESIKASFDWIKPYLLGLVDQDPSQFHAMKSHLVTARNALTSSSHLVGDKSGTGAGQPEEVEHVVDAWGGNYSSINNVMSAEMWKGNTAVNFKLNYLNPLPVQATNAVKFMGVLWAAADANETIIRNKHNEVAAVALGTLSALGGSPNFDTGEQGLPTWFWPVLGAVLAVTATVLTAGIAAVPAISAEATLALGVASTAAGTLGTFHVGESKHHQGKHQLGSVKVSGGTAEEILDSMVAKLNDVGNHVLDEINKVTTAVDKTSKLLEGKGKHYIVAPKPGLARGSDGDLHGLFDRSGVH